MQNKLGSGVQGQLCCTRAKNFFLNIICKAIDKLCISRKVEINWNLSRDPFKIVKALNYYFIDSLATIEESLWVKTSIGGCSFAEQNCITPLRKSASICLFNEYITWMKCCTSLHQGTGLQTTKSVSTCLEAFIIRQE